MPISASHKWNEFQSSAEFAVDEMPELTSYELGTRRTVRIAGVPDVLGTEQRSSSWHLSKRRDVRDKKDEHICLEWGQAKERVHMTPEALKLVDLITKTSVRYVVPVFQRAYAWEKAHCGQLWDDILSVARRSAPTHFTGSVVLVQDDTMCFDNKTPCLVIDGQQRLTTVTLLIIALARYARSHPEEDLPFSLEEIIDDRYLLDKRRKGDDRYALILSQGDRDVLIALEENLVNPDVTLPTESSRIVDNLSFFEKRLEDIEDVGLVWRGLRKLQVISISLSQGIDDPQLIFESMNSTGKDLASSDLIRNFVLMRQTPAEQAELYEVYWRPVEQILDTQCDDLVFDEFVRWWLTSIKAAAVSRKDIYQTFKDYAYDGGFVDEPGGMEHLLADMRRNASYFANITRGAEKDADLRKALRQVDDLGITVSRALLIHLYNERDQGRFVTGDFVSMVKSLESFLFRRAACCSTAGLNKFFPALIGRLRDEVAEGPAYVSTFDAILLAESAGSTYFPSDEEFEQRLATMNIYKFKLGKLLLERLENSWHPKEQRDLAGYTVEHIMPQNALKHKEWCQAISPNASRQELESAFEKHVHTLGNLTLTAYNSELSDGTFEEKRERALAGYNNDIISISQALRDAKEWTPAQIEDRGAALAKRAVGIWPKPVAAADVTTDRGGSIPVGGAKHSASFKELVYAGVIPAGSQIYCTSHDAPAVATVLADGKLKIEGQDKPFNTLNRLMTYVFARVGKINDRNAWDTWRLNSPKGPKLKEVRDSFSR